jgi:hypothetical protein
VTLASRPVGFPQESDFVVDEAELPSPRPGEVLVRTTWVSVDPYQRSRMSTVRSYAKGLELGRGPRQAVDHCGHVARYGVPAGR